MFRLGTLNRQTIDKLCINILQSEILKNINCFGPKHSGKDILNLCLKRVGKVPLLSTKGNETVMSNCYMNTQPVFQGGFPDV